MYLRIVALAGAYAIGAWAAIHVTRTLSRSRTESDGSILFV